MRKRLSVLLAVIVGVLAGGLVVGTALIGASAHPSSTAAVSSADGSASCGLRFRDFPAALRADLKAVRALPKAERYLAMRKIRKAALAGKYGPTVQRITEHRRALHKVIVKKLPVSFREALRKARHMTGEQRLNAIKALNKDALAGKYGPEVQRIAENRKERRAECRADNSPSSTPGSSSGKVA